MRSLLIHSAIFLLAYTSINMTSYSRTINMLSEGKTPSQIERLATFGDKPFLKRDYLGFLGREIAYLEEGKKALNESLNLK